MMENGAGLACISEPPATPTLSVGSTAATPLWLFIGLPRKSVGVLSYAGRDFVAVKFSHMYVVSVYVSPSKDLDYFLDFLDELRDYYLSIGGSPMLMR